MDIKEYCKYVNDYLDSLTDEEFDKLLIECGIEKCDFYDETIGDD